MKIRLMSEPGSGEFSPTGTHDTSGSEIHRQSPFNAVPRIRISFVFRTWTFALCEGFRYGFPDCPMRIPVQSGTTDASRREIS